MSVLSSTYKRFVETDLFWRHVINFRPSREFRRYPLRLPAESQRILEELNRTGMACTHIDQFPELNESFDALKRRSLQLEAAKANAVARRGRQGSSVYAFNANILGSFPKFDASSVFARFSTHLSLLDIVNAYFGMFAQLRKYAVFRNVATSEPQGVNSSWHRDSAFDTMVLRIFVYFSDINADNGALLYAPNTHKKSRFGSKQVLSNEELDSRAVAISGRAGTVVFADTRAYHKAGPFISGERWFYNSLFTSPGFGADYFSRSTRSHPHLRDPVSWALASPMRFTDNFISASEASRRVNNRGIST